MYSWDHGIVRLYPIHFIPLCFIIVYIQYNTQYNTYNSITIEVLPTRLSYMNNIEVHNKYLKEKFSGKVILCWDLKSSETVFWSNRKQQRVRIYVESPHHALRGPPPTHTQRGLSWEKKLILFQFNGFKGEDSQINCVCLEIVEIGNCV